MGRLDSMEIKPQAWEAMRGKRLAWGGWIPGEIEPQAWEAMEKNGPVRIAIKS